MRIIDIRSDTGTLPTDKMREAMKKAVVGDDVCKDDPTVNLLEKKAAKITGKQAALFVPSGTFGNQVSLLTHCNRGDEVLLHDKSHIIQHEAGASAIIAGVQLRAIDSVDGLMDLNELEYKIRKVVDQHFPVTKLICLENALSNGKVLPLSYMKDTYDLAKKYNIKVHLDGARLFNAAISLNVPVSDITKYTDSVTFCLSKGLGAPIGSIIAGTKEFINKAIYNRKIMGGGMRQAGVIAAPGIIAMEEMVNRLSEDHKNAKDLATLMNELPLVNIMTNYLDINMVFFTIKQQVDEIKMVNFFKEYNILIYPPEEEVFRFVTNYGVKSEDIPYIVNVLEKFLSK
ncbi:MAG: low-specificity L-threonine aldolase [Clostridiales bacterium]|nr:low-specificity L-threonine aldolase [Clostridiales bacterium]